MYDKILSVLVSALGVMAIIMPFVIEFIKTLMTEENVVKMFGVLERFCALMSAIAGLLVYVAIYILSPLTFKDVNVAQTIVIGIIFIGACSIASQVGYDKVIKWVINKK